MGGSNDDAARSVLEVSPGKYLVTGITNSHDGDVSFNHNSNTYDIWTVMLSEISTDIVAIENENIYDISFYANEGTLKLVFSSRVNDEITMEIFNITGSRLVMHTARISEGVNSFAIPGNYKAGSYCLKITGKNYQTIGSQSKVFVVVD